MPVFGALFLLGLFGLTAVTINRGIFNNAGNRNLGASPLLKTGAIKPPPSALSTLARFARSKRPIPTALLNDALLEAYEKGDWKLIAALSERLDRSPPPIEATPAPTEETTSLVIGRNSPIDGVSNDEWEAFIDKLKTNTADYTTDKHIGAYHHHRERLSQLGVDPDTLTDEESQYQALAKDIASYSSAERKLIADYGGELIDLPGQSATSNADGSNTHCVTTSGILGVLKAAGPKNARAWFRSADDRANHPKTTEAFLATNGIF